MTYSVDFDSESIKKKFFKALQKIKNKKIQDDIMNSVLALAKNPRPFGKKSFKQISPSIELYQLTANYRIRIGNYRVLYDVDDLKKTVWIIVLRKRSEKTYKKM